MISIGLTSYVVRNFNGVRYYVGYVDGYFKCRRYIESTTVALPFPDGENLSEITASNVEATPGFDIWSSGVLVADIPTDAVGGADRYISKDAGYTWELIESD
jgi:hypothetical protein